MIYIYDDNKAEYWSVDFISRMQEKGVTSVVLNNFMPMEEQVKAMKALGLEVYISTKVFNGEYITEIPLILQLGAKVALDCEAYSETADEGTCSHSLIWQSPESALEVSRVVKELIPFGSEVLVYPEPLDPQVYLYYENFLECVKRHWKMRLMLELTYQRWKPWQIVDSFKSNEQFNPVCAIWPKKLPGICRFIQRLTIKRLSKDLFFYSENKTDWQKYL